MSLQKKVNLILAPQAGHINREHIYRDDIGEVLVYLNDATLSAGLWVVAPAGETTWREFLTKQEALRVALQVAIEKTLKQTPDALIFWDAGVFDVRDDR